MPMKRSRWHWRNCQPGSGAIRTWLITGAVLVAIMVAYRLASGGFNGNVAGAVVATVISVATYVPVVFVVEEVLFRGLIDTYLTDRRPDLTVRRPSTVRPSGASGTCRSRSSRSAC